MAPALERPRLKPDTAPVRRQQAAATQGASELAHSKALPKILLPVMGLAVPGAGVALKWDSP
jgi:hypothetical protein